MIRSALLGLSLLGATLPEAQARSSHFVPRSTSRSIPVKPQAGLFQRGQAVFYGGRFDRATRMTAAHRTLPFGTWVRVTSVGSGRSVLVKINDRGPFGSRSRVIDLSATAARALGITRQGVAPVTLRIVSRP